jgi:hypothetical protein
MWWPLEQSPLFQAAPSRHWVWHTCCNSTIQYELFLTSSTLIQSVLARYFCHHNFNNVRTKTVMQIVWYLLVQPLYNLVLQIFTCIFPIKFGIILYLYYWRQSECSNLKSQIHSINLIRTDTSCWTFYHQSILTWHNKRLNNDVTSNILEN